MIDSKTQSVLFPELLAKRFEVHIDEPETVSDGGAILTRAIEKSILGYIPQEVDPVTSFWHDYWRLCTELAPELQMPEPGPKPARAGFVLFQPVELPKGIKLIHKLPYGNVDLQFSGMGKRLADLRDRVGPHVEHNMSIQPANKSGSVRLRVPVLDTSLALASQDCCANEGIEAASRLLRWYLRITPEINE